MGASIKAAGAGGRKRRRHGHAPMSEINVTPFVDVMLVLLIIFMVAAPLMTGGITVDLPKGNAKPIDAPKKEPIIISITKDGKIYLGQNDKDVFSVDELKGKLQALKTARGEDAKDDAVFFRGDQSSNYGTANRVLTLITDLGFRKISFVKITEGG